VTPEIVVETLHARARRSYERGRLAVAARAAFLVIPLTAICARETEAYARCAVIGVLLLVATVGARWRLRRGMRAANAGLLTGILPMTAALVLCRFAAAWPPEAAVAACTSAGLIAGALAARRTMDPSSLLIAGLTAALGCIGIGFGTAVGGGLGVAAGAGVSLILNP
jgi:hypothetical protein